MQNGLLTLSWGNVKSALISGLVMAILAIIGYAQSVGDFSSLNLRTLINVGIFAGLGVIQSLIKNFLTSNKGNFLGVVDTKT